MTNEQPPTYGARNAPDDEPAPFPASSDPTNTGADAADATPADLSTADPVDATAGTTDTDAVAPDPPAADAVLADTAGSTNAGPSDAIPSDSEPSDAERIDAERIDAEPVDAEPVDAEPVDDVIGDLPPAASDRPPTGPPPPPVGDRPGFAGPNAVPPGTGGYATQFGLVRPNQGRYLAGVCAALGRATNTDPVLWRVLLPVLTLLGGLGALLYIVGWLTIPAERDTGSPIEALAGRGRSTTSTGMTVALLVVATLIMLDGVAHIGRGLFLAAAVIGGVLLLATSRGSRPPGWPTLSRTPGSFTFDWGRPKAGTNPPTGPSWGAPVPSTGSAAATPTATGWPGAPTPGGVVTTDLSSPAAAGPADFSATGYRPAEESTGAPEDEFPGSRPTVVMPPLGPTYQAPFAPNGPFTPYSPYPSEFPVLGPDTTYPPAAPPPRGRRSPGRRIALSAALLVVGVLALLDVANAASIPGPAYLAAALATIGICMVIASFFGRVRGPITIGVLLACALLVASAVSRVNPDIVAHGDTVYRPLTVQELRPDYVGRVGQVTLDLSNIDFTGTDRTVEVAVKAGQVTVILPPNVDVTVDARAGVGDVNVLGQDLSGFGRQTTITDNGADGPGGGRLHIDAHVSVGQVEVSR